MGIPVYLWEPKPLGFIRLVLSSSPLQKIIIIIKTTRAFVFHKSMMFLIQVYQEQN
jgi:hypothetical protein